ncbi:unnamed protein product [Psylliodes chrysocephalus]|uniref:DUF4806 domain-containing protein n=1 Tax=Psylliodes chrysocephalus TaxID=3402493 RepID=A0A9P0CY57_9CUCU|nr:unnamed protein product [Psylliodes chrysocephala]
MTTNSEVTVLEADGDETSDTSKLLQKIAKLLITQKKILNDQEKQIQQITFKTNEIYDVLKALTDEKKSDQELQITDVKVFDQIPITTPDGLAYIESLIAEKTSFNLLLTDFSRLGAANYKELIRRIMRQLMTDSVAKLYSVHGHKGKTSFSKTTCFRAVIGI